MIAVAAHESGSVLPVLAHAGAKRNAVLGERAGALRVAVTAPPERGKANEAIQTLLAEVLKIKPSRISLLSGPTARQKRFLLVGIDSDDLAARLTALVSETAAGGMPDDVRSLNIPRP